MTERVPHLDRPECPRCRMPSATVGILSECWLTCALCERGWDAPMEDVDRARRADTAWMTCALSLGSFRDWIRRKLADEQAKIARLREGRW